MGKICKIYVCLFVIFLIIQPDFKKAAKALTWGLDVVAKQYSIFTLFYILVIIMGIKLYQRRGS